MTVFSIIKNVNNVSSPIFSQILQTSAEVINNQSTNNSLVNKVSKTTFEEDNNFIKFIYPLTAVLSILFFTTLAIGSINIFRETFRNENQQNLNANNPSNSVNNPNIEARIVFLNNDLV
jgi:hypothetical protein